MAMYRAWTIVCGTALLLAITSPVRADDPLPSETERARAHYRKAQQAYDVGRWDEAIAEYELAYSLRNDPSFLYNMAQANRRKGDARRALDLYRNYLVKVPQSPQRPEIEDRIRALQKQVDREDQDRRKRGLPALPATAAPPVSASPVATPVPPPASVSAPAGASPPPESPAPVVVPVVTPDAPVVQPSPPMPVAAPADTVAASPTEDPSQAGRGLRIAGLVSGGAGVLATAAGILASLRASSLSDEVTDDARNRGVFSQSKYDEGQRYETLQWVGYGVGAAALLGGATLYWLGFRASAKAAGSPATVTALPALGGGHVGGNILFTY